MILFVFFIKWFPPFFFATADGSSLRFSAVSCIKAISLELSLRLVLKLIITPIFIFVNQKSHSGKIKARNIFPGGGIKLLNINIFKAEPFGVGNNGIILTTAYPAVDRRVL